MTFSVYSERGQTCGFMHIKIIFFVSGTLQEFISRIKAGRHILEQFF